MSTVQEAVDAAKLIRDTIDHVSGGKDTSISSAIRKTIISCRLLIDRNCAQDAPFLTDTIGTLQKMYAGWVLTALQLQQVDVNTGKSINRTIDTVATENYKELQTDSDFISSFENGFVKQIRKYDDKEKNTEDLDHLEKIIKDTTMDQDDLDKINKNSIIKNIQDQKYGSTIDEVKIEKSLNLPTGTTIPVKFSSGSGTATINLTVLTPPNFVDYSILKELFKFSFPKSLMQRWFQVKTKEISFFKDFLFELDKTEELNQAMKKDKSGVLSDIELQNAGRIRKHITKLFTGKKSLNTANCIVIIDKRNFDILCRESRIDFKKYNDSGTSDRDKFFRAINATGLVVADYDYRTVDFYYAGVSYYSTFTFDQCKSMSKDSNNDIAAIMKYFAGNGSNAKF